VSEDRSVEETANDVLMRQAKARADRTGEPIEKAMEAVLNTEAGAQLRELRDVHHDEESVEEWHRLAWRGSERRSGRKISASISTSPRSTPRTADALKFAE
jgi:hypothetical protein